MKQVFSSSLLHPRDRLSVWYDVAVGVYVGHQCRFNPDTVFNALLEVESLSDIDVSIIESNQIDFVRTSAEMSRDEDRYGFLCFIQSGQAKWDHNGREGTAMAGDFMLLDSQIPYTFGFVRPSRMLVLRVLMRALEQRVGPTVAFTGIRVHGDESLGGLVSGFLALLPGRLPLRAASEEARLAELTLDLVAMALLATRDRKPMLSSARAVALAALQSTIDANLSDPGLDTQTVAALAGISVRYASDLLSEQGSSIKRYILQRRLERCRRLLADPSQRHRTITDIALSWGFSDPSHFGRRFKEVYGVSPRDFRDPGPGAIDADETGLV